ncbi:MAG: helix-turn-helix transcriptional regulator [Clostridia bacterium]|nr:helix-turn-helix transcriptional regulator [Clostridia bacterium]
MYLHSFRFIAPKKVSEAQKFTLIFTDADKIETVADKLRYYRYKKGMYQLDVADYLGIDKGTYIDYENPDRDYYSAEIMEKLAELFEVDVHSLLDEYNKFLYDGQGRNIKELRKHLKITQEDLAREMNVSLLKVKRWEQNKVRMFKFTWGRLTALVNLTE